MPDQDGNIVITATLLQSKVDAMGIVRIEQPLRALERLGGFKIADIAKNPRIGKGGRDIFIWQRPTLTDEFLPFYRKILSTHRVFVVEYDDHPDAFPNLKATNYRAFRAAHAVRVSTPMLADLVRPHNPNVFVSPNAIDTLPPYRPVQGRPKALRLFFGAVNREKDWAPYMDTLNSVISPYTPDQLQVHVVHDHAFFDQVQAQDKLFFPLLPYADYQYLLGKADIAWLPLRDTPFNRAKSDLKFIECAAHSVAVLAGRTVYESSVENGRTGMIYDTPKEFGRKLKQLLGDAGLRGDLSRRAHDYVAANRVRTAAIDAEAEWYRSLLINADELEARRQGRLGAEPDWRVAVS